MTYSPRTKQRNSRDLIPHRSKLETRVSFGPLVSLAKREGNRKKPIYEMHKWWARRLGVNFRFLLLNAISDSSIHENTIWRRFYQPDKKLNLTVFDPFMGGGTSIVESIKLGARIIGCDIDPLSWFIVSKQIGEFNEETFMSTWKDIKQDLANQLRSYYKTRVNGKLADVIYNFWVEIIPCESCGNEFEGHIHYIIYSKKKDFGAIKTRIGFCHVCHEIYRLNDGEKFIDCACGAQTEVDKGNLYLGKYRCPNCHHEGHIHNLPEDRLPLKHRLFAVEYIDPDTGERAYKKSDIEDQKAYENACQELRHLWKELPIPNERIPIKGRSDLRPIRFGYKHYHELFNRRQLLCLALILRRIIQVENTIDRELLLLAFSDSLASNNWFCSYAFGYRKLTPLFGLHAYHRISRPVEGNVWGTAIGRGSFSSCVEKVLRGKRFSLKPFEYFYETNRPRRIEGITSAQAVIVENVKNLLQSDGQTAYLAIADSRDLTWIPERSVDLVLTDPPYYDNIAYSEMADFYFVWLKNHVNWAVEKTPEHSPINDSLYVRKPDEYEHHRYTIGLTRAFSGCRKVIKRRGIMVFTYHHSNQNAWEALALALRSADFYVTNCFPILSEGKSGFHSDYGNLKWDIVFVCRPGVKERIPTFKPGPAKRWIQSRLAKWGIEARSAGEDFGDADRRSFIYGLMTAYLSKCTVTTEDVKVILKSLDIKSLTN